MKLGDKILDILKRLSVDFDQIDNYDYQWRGQQGKKKFYLDSVYYDGREVRIEDVRDMIMKAIMDNHIDTRICRLCKHYNSGYCSLHPEYGELCERDFCEDWEEL